MPTRSGSGGELGIGLVGALDVLAPDERDLRRLFRVQVVLLTRPRHVVRAADDRLHPSEPGVACRADLLLAERRGRERHEYVAARVQDELAAADTRPHDLAL